MKLFEKIRKLDKGTIVRTILLVLGWANQIVAIIGSTSFASATWYQVVTVVLTVLISGITYWYNNDWTQGALLTRDLFDMLQDGKITKEEVEEFIAKHNKKDK